MRSLLFISGVLIIMLLSCKKASDRKCLKGNGGQDSLVIALDSISTFNLYKDIKFNIYESDEKKLVVKGGENIISQINLSYDNQTISIANDNKCHFLRTGSRSLEVDIFYPTYSRFYIEASDSVTFKDTIHSNLDIEMRNGGGSLFLNVDNTSLKIVVSKGTADYTLGGTTGYAELKVQNNGYGDALNLEANSIFTYQNSTADLYLNFEGANVSSLIDGTGDIFYKGVAISIIEEGNGSGKLLQY